MSDATALAIEVLRDLVATPNGQIRLLGAVMCIGPGYSIMEGGQEVSMFVYAMLGLGAGFILLSAALAVMAAKFSAHSVVDERVEDRDGFPPSDRLEKFCDTVLNIGRTKADLAEANFSQYNPMNKHDLYSLLMQSTAKECVLSGIAKFHNGRYISRDTTEQTIITVGDADV